MVTADRLTLEIVAGELAVCRLDTNAAIPDWASGPITSITRTVDELSIVCCQEEVPASVRSELGWRCLRVVGPLEFSMVGVIASFTGILATANIGVFVVSTFDTDLVLVKQADLEPAIESLTAAGHVVRS